MNNKVIAGLILLMLLFVSGASACSKGTAGTSSASCGQGNVESTCPDGTVKCCLGNWICCDEEGGNVCAPKFACSNTDISDPFKGT